MRWGMNVKGKYKGGREKLMPIRKGGGGVITGLDKMRTGKNKRACNSQTLNFSIVACHLEERWFVVGGGWGGRTIMGD